MAASCRPLPTSASSGQINFYLIVVELLSKEGERREARMKEGRRREGGTIKNSEYVGMAGLGRIEWMPKDGSGKEGWKSFHAK